MHKAMYVKRSGAGWNSQPPGKPAKFFSDAKHGGKAAAFDKAARHAQRATDKARVNPASGRFVRDPSEAAGVFRVVVKRKSATGETLEYASWVAEAGIKKGKKTQERFAVGKHGEAGARALAVKARAKMVKRVLA